MKSKNNESLAYQAVLDGELIIDDRGQIWRVGKRIWSRWLKKTVLRKVKKVRAEHRLPAGYLQIRVMRNKKRVHVLAHRLIYYHFHGEIPKDMTINHKNGMKSDNYPKNLELMTSREQAIHAVRILKRGKAANQYGNLNSMSKLTDRQVLEIKERRNLGETLISIAKDYPICYQTVWEITTGKIRTTTKKIL